MDEARVLRTLLSSPATAAAHVDPTGTVLAWSPGAELLLGRCAGDVVGRQLVELLAPPGSDGWEGLRGRLDAGPSLPVRCRTAEGALLDVDLDALPLEGDGRLVLLCRARPGEGGTVVSAAQEELRARFEASPVAQSLVDLAGQVRSVNPAMERLLGIPAAELIGTSAVELYSEDEREHVLAALGRLAAGEIASAAEERTLLRGDGSRRRTVTSVTTVRNAAGEPLLACAVEDVTELRAVEEVVRAQADLFDAVVSSMPIVVFSWDRDGTCTSSRGQALRSLGLADDELVGTDLRAAYAGDPVFLDGLAATLRGEPASSVTRVDDRVYKAHHRPLRGPTGEVVGGLGVAHDVTSLVRAEQEVRGNEARLEGLLRHASDVVTVVDRRGRLLYVSPAIRTMLGYDERALFWQPAGAYNHPEDRDVIRAAWDRILPEHGATETFECRVLHADGTWRWTEHRFTNLLGDPDVGGMVVNLRDITDQRRAAAELRRQAVEDGLTGLANRTLLLDRIDQALQRGRRRGDSTGLVLLDVVGMGRHNEALGHAGGDVLLQQVARRLSAAVRPVDSLARVASDAFAVLYEDATSAEDLRARAAALVRSLSEPVLVGDLPVPVELAVGVAASPADDAGSLLAAAERALLGDVGQAPSLHPLPSTVDAAATAELRRAMEDGQLRLHFQPSVRLSDGRPVGAEALVRWQHPQRGLLLPVDFIPLAEASGLVVELGAWVLTEACRAVAQWRRAGRDLSVGVNLSPRQLAVPGFDDVVRRALAATGADAHALVLEVTESALLDATSAFDALRSLKALGVRLALDDFGTGYSSLTYLKRFPVDILKVDRSFVAGLGRDADDAAIVASVASLGQSIGKLVVAEGVETAAQRDALHALGVDQAQGWLWAPALSSADLEQWLDQQEALPAAHPAAAPAPGPAATVLPGSDEERILQLHAEGASLSTIAAGLNAEGRRTPSGPRWHSRSVARVIVQLLPVR